MSFVVIPICYIEGDPITDEDDEITRLRRKAVKKPEVKEADVTINTHQICSYVGVDESNHTIVNMSDGSSWECTYDRETFDDLIIGADALIDLTTLNEN